MGKSSYQPKRFAVVGAGPVGSIVAAFLAKGGYDVTLCDLVPSLLAPAMDPGIRIEGTDTFQAKVARTTTRVDDLIEDPPDVVIVAVKATALPLIASTLEGLAAGGRYIVSWQNGIDTERVLAKHLGAEFVLRATADHVHDAAGRRRFVGVHDQIQEKLLQFTVIPPYHSRLFAHPHDESDALLLETRPEKLHRLPQRRAEIQRMPRPLPRPGQRAEPFQEALHP